MTFWRRCRRINWHNLAVLIAITDCLYFVWLAPHSGRQLAVMKHAIIAEILQYVIVRHSQHSTCVIPAMYRLSLQIAVVSMPNVACTAQSAFQIPKVAPRLRLGIPPHHQLFTQIAWPFRIVEYDYLVRMFKRSREQCHRCLITPTNNIRFDGVTAISNTSCYTLNVNIGLQW